MCLEPEFLALPEGIPDQYEYIMSDDPVTINKMVTEPVARCEVTYSYSILDVREGTDIEL